MRLTSQPVVLKIQSGFRQKIIYTRVVNLLGWLYPMACHATVRVAVKIDTREYQLKPGNSGGTRIQETGDRRQETESNS